MTIGQGAKQSARRARMGGADTELTAEARHFRLGWISGSASLGSQVWRLPRPRLVCCRSPIR